MLASSGLLYSSTHKSRDVKNMYSGCYLLGKREVLLLWTTGKIKIFMHISMSCPFVCGDGK